MTKEEIDKKINEVAIANVDKLINVFFTPSAAHNPDMSYSLYACEIQKIINGVVDESSSDDDIMEAIYDSAYIVYIKWLWKCIS